MGGVKACQDGLGHFFPHLPVWQRGGEAKLFGQCPYRTHTFQKGASLSKVKWSLVWLLFKISTIKYCWPRFLSVSCQLLQNWLTCDISCLRSVLTALRSITIRCIALQWYLDVYFAQHAPTRATCRQWSVQKNWINKNLTKCLEEQFRISYGQCVA